MRLRPCLSPPAPHHGWRTTPSKSQSVRVCSVVIGGGGRMVQLCQPPTDLHQYDPLPQRGFDVLTISLSLSPLYCLSSSSSPAANANANAHAVDAVDANSVDSANGNCGPDRLLRKRDNC